VVLLNISVPKGWSDLGFVLTGDELTCLSSLVHHNLSLSSYLNPPPGGSNFSAETNNLTGVSAFRDVDVVDEGGCSLFEFWSLVVVLEDCPLSLGAPSANISEIEDEWLLATGLVEVTGNQEVFPWPLENVTGIVPFAFTLPASLDFELLASAIPGDQGFQLQSRVLGILIHPLSSLEAWDLFLTRISYVIVWPWSVYPQNSSIASSSGDLAPNYTSSLALLSSEGSCGAGGSATLDYCYQVRELSFTIEDCENVSASFSLDHEFIFKLNPTPSFSGFVDLILPAQELCQHMIDTVVFAKQYSVFGFQELEQMLTALNETQGSPEELYLDNPDLVTIYLNPDNISLSVCLFIKATPFNSDGLNLQNSLQADIAYVEMIVTTCSQ